MTVEHWPLNIESEGRTFESFRAHQCFNILHAYNRANLAS